MSYVGTGSGNTQTADERRAEADRILKILADFDPHMTEKEAEFVDSMDGSNYISPKQLWWLRDLKEKYAE